MPRILLPLPEIKPGTLSITGENARYLSTVLRCRAGDPISLTDSVGISYSGKIIRATRKEVEVEIDGAGRVADVESPVAITLLQGLLKGDKMDLVIRKSTELGVTEVVPVITERSQVRETRKIERWQKIAREASRQSGRSNVPVVRDPVDITSLLGGRPLSGRGIMFWEQGGERLSTVIGRLGRSEKIELLTGPEGGFSEDEAGLAREKGFLVATLGRRILRAETAAIVALGIVQYELGDLGA